MDITQGAILRDMEDKKSKEDLDTLNLSVLSNVDKGFGNMLEEKQYDENDITQPFYTGVGGGARFHIVHCSTEKCKKENLHGGWLLPDGTFFGGSGIWIHRGILDELFEREMFKDAGYSLDEDSVQEDGNWIKFSGGTWFIWEHKHKLTKEQVEFIIQYTTEVDNSTYLKVGSYTLIHLTVFAKILSGEKFDEWEMKEKQTYH